MVSALLFSSVAFALVGMELSAPGACPTRDAVVREYVALGMESRTLEGVRISLEGTGTQRVVLLESPEGLRVRRELPSASSCEGLAETIAVVAAAWRSESGGVVLEAPAATSAPTSGPRLAWELGAAVRGPVGAPPASWGVSIPFWLRPSGRAFGLRAQLSYDFPRSYPFADGSILLQRGVLGVGGHLGLYRPRWLLEGHVELLGAVLSLRGDNFEASRAATGGDIGVGVGGRVGIRLHEAAAFLQIGASAWAVRNTVRILGVDDAFSLPRAEWTLLAGISWRSPLSL